MIRSFILGIAAWGLAISPVAANGLYNDFDAHADWRSNGAAYAGAYLTYRFGSGVRSSKPALSYGFRAGLQPGALTTRTTAPHWSQSVSPYGPARPVPIGLSAPVQLDVLTINFSERGFEKTNFVGVPVLAAQSNQGLWRLGANEDIEEEKEDGVPGWLLITGGVIAVGVGVIALAADAIEDGFEDLDLSRD